MCFLILKKKCEGVQMLAISLAGTSWAHNSRVGFKLATLSLISILIFFITNWILLLFCLIGIVFLYYSVSFNALRKGMNLLHPIVLVIGLIWIFHILRGEYLSGIIICLRLVVLVALANFVTLTSKLSDMMELFLWILNPLKLIGIKTAPIALALGMVIRFTPVLIERAKQLSQSWRARGLRYTNWRIIIPIFITVIDDADRVSEAIRARGGV